MTKSPRKAPIPPPPKIPDEHEATVGDLFRLPAENPSLEGFEMADEPFEEASQVEDLGNPAPEFLPSPSSTAAALIEPEAHVTYESRIQILEAFRYQGHFRDAPAWVDRNWLGHGDYDPLRKIEPGPALRVPLDSGVVMARIGDYIVRQAVTIDPSVPAEVRVEVWTAETFQKLFLPKARPPTGVRIDAAPSEGPQKAKSSPPPKPSLSQPIVASSEFS